MATEDPTRPLEAIERIGIQKLAEIIQEIRRNEDFSLRQFAETCKTREGNKVGHNTIKRIEDTLDGKPYESELSLQTLAAIANSPYISENYSFQHLIDMVFYDTGSDIQRDIVTAEDIIAELQELPVPEKKKIIVLLTKQLPKKALDEMLPCQVDLFIKHR